MHLSCVFTSGFSKLLHRERLAPALKSGTTGLRTPAWGLPPHTNCLLGSRSWPRKVALLGPLVLCCSVMLLSNELPALLLCSLPVIEHRCVGSVNGREEETSHIGFFIKALSSYLYKITRIQFLLSIIFGAF